MTARSEAHRRHAAHLVAAGRHAEALAELQRAVEADERHFDAWHDLGNLLLLAGRIAAGLEALRRAVALRPDAWTTRINRALTLANVTGDVEPALQELEARLAVAPDDRRAGRNRLFLLTAGGTRPAEEVFAQHRAWGAQLAAATPPAGPRPPARARLRLGFLSPDFRDHPVTRFLLPLWANLDRARFEIFAYYDHAHADEATAALQRHADQWRVVAGRADPEVLAAMRADELDVLFDLAGHTADARGDVLARQPAPAVCTWLGYPNTTGIPAVRYRVTDALADPPGSADRLYTEELVRLPRTAWCYSPAEPTPPVTEPPLVRAGFPTFGCYNTTLKYSPRTLALWSRVLQRVPTARLRLKSRFFMDPAVGDHFRGRLAALGVAPQRIDCLPWTASPAAHLQSHAQVDVALDTFPYHGTTTTCDALFMGVPVVALAGDTHVSRVGVSLLHQVGHPEWAAEREDDYVALAARLVADPAALARTRRELRARMTGSALMDGPGFARDFGAACARMCRAPSVLAAPGNAT